MFTVSSSISITRVRRGPNSLKKNDTKTVNLSFRSHPIPLSHLELQIIAVLVWVGPELFLQCYLNIFTWKKHVVRFTRL